jgi:hypothetical protein
MSQIAHETKDKPDARVRYLIDWIETNLKTGDAWGNTRLIVFTEYEDTRRYLVACLRNHFGEDEGYRRVEYYSGITNPDERERIKRDFNADPAAHPLRVLVATDAAREGLNLQSWCFNLFHFDVPWNPGRLEQRNGRIDRKLQKAPKVYCRYFIYKQRPEDRILDTLVKKTGVIHRELGSLAQVLETRMERLLKNGISREFIQTLEAELANTDLDAQIKAVTTEELEETRKRHEQLQGTVATLRTRLNAAQKKIGLDERHLRDSIDCSLQLMNIGGMQPQRQDDGTARYQFPDLARQRGADPSWESTLKTLRPRQAEAEQDLLPVVFTALEQSDDTVIQLHLEHKLVKRLLSRFLSQGFLHNDLSRACLVQTRDAVPRVALIGRLSVYGKGATRLHEEIVNVTARWVEPGRRSTVQLQKYSSDTEEKTLEHLEEALSPEGQTLTPSAAQRQGCATTMEQDIRDLVPLLGDVAQAALEKARTMLQERGQKEAKSLRTLLEEQRKRVIKQRDEDDQNQANGLLLFDFNEEEIRQYKENRKYWDQWLKDAEAKLQSEPVRIIEFYTPISWRIEPVGIAYLMPAGNQE